MKYQKLIHLIDITPSQPSKFTTKIWVEINDGVRERYNTNSQINFKNIILNSSLCDQSDA